LRLRVFAPLRGLRGKATKEDHMRRQPDFITAIANYIIDMAEAGWNLEDILDHIHGDSSEVTLAEVQAALAVAYADDTSDTVKKLATKAVVDMLEHCANDPNCRE
jgi:hypothetical protein